MSQWNNNGWIKLHRNMLENPVIMKDSERIAIWIYLLLSATHKDVDVIFGGERITLHPGQLITGRKRIATDLKVNESKIERVLNRFETEHQIEQLKTHQNRLITILNWEMYQQIEQPNEQQVNNYRTTSEQQVNTNKNVRIKECKNKENIYIPHFQEFWSAYPRKIDKKKAYKCYKARLKEGFSEDELLIAAKNYAEECKKENRDPKYIKHPTTFLSVDTPFAEYIKGEPNNGKSDNSTTKQFTDEELDRFADLV